MCPGELFCYIAVATFAPWAGCSFGWLLYRLIRLIVSAFPED